MQKKFKINEYKTFVFQTEINKIWRLKKIEIEKIFPYIKNILKTIQNKNTWVYF